MEDIARSAIVAKKKKQKMDLDALEAEGLGVGDLGSRNDGRRQTIGEERERFEAETKHKAYQSAYARADEAIKSLLMEQTLPVKLEEEPIVDDFEDLHKSLERARKLALKKQGEASYGPEAIARLVGAAATSQTATADEQNILNVTELHEVVWGLPLPLDKGVQKQYRKDEGPRTCDLEMNDEVKYTEATEEEEINPDETIRELAVGKGLSGVLKLFKDRGALKEGIEWGGRKMDKKKSKLVDDNADTDDNRFKDIRIERRDEFGRIMTPKEAFRMISHKFHGKGPGKMKQEKRMKQFQEELKLKQMTESVERMKEAQARQKTPYLILSGNVIPGQTSDPRSCFPTVEKDLPGGNPKVENFKETKRKAESENTDSPKKPKC